MDQTAWLAQHLLFCEMTLPLLSLALALARIVRHTDASARSRRHEVQLGQNKETHTRLKKAARLALAGGREAGAAVSFKVSDATAHWPRLWRALVTDDELQDILHPEGGAAVSARACAAAVRQQFAELDSARAANLSHPDEGILFVTHECECVCIEHFELNEFPYDTQALSIKVKIEKGHDDPLGRYILPLCTDKAFFCT